MMIMTRIALDFGLLLALLSCATCTRIRVQSVSGSRITSSQRTRSTARFSPQPHATCTQTTTRAFFSSSSLSHSRRYRYRYRPWQTAVLSIRGGGDGGGLSTNVNVTEPETIEKENTTMKTTTITATENEPATETATAPTTTTELAYSLTGLDKVVIPAKTTTQDKATKKEAVPAADTTTVRSLEAVDKVADADLPIPPPAIVETTTTTIVDSYDFSRNSKENSKAAENKQVDGDSAVVTDTHKKDNDNENELEGQEHDKQSSFESTQVMLDEHVQDLENLISNDNNKPLLSVDETRKCAAELRLQGKELHDTGDYIEAADCFGAAADLMYPYFVKHHHHFDGGQDNNKNMDEQQQQQPRHLDDDENNNDSLFDLSENFCTLRLHEALCRLKALDYEAAESACSQVLDGSGSNSNSNNKNNSNNIHLSPAVRARALFRRAKARIEMNMLDEAMQDARIAAFLGDRKAVALYGQLMREMSSSTSSSLSSLSSATMDNNNNSGNSLASSASLLASLLDKSTGAAGDGGFVPGGFSPLSSSSSGNGAGMDFNPLSLLSMLQPGAANGGDSGGGSLMGSGGGGVGSLAKSVLTSLSKRLDDENTQQSICSFLQQASGPQLQQYAIMAGVQLPASQADKIASFCQSITPSGLQRTVQNSKRFLYCIQLIRKTMAVLNKYKMIIFLIVLITWIKSAILRPIPINKRLARKTAREAAKMAATTAAAAATTAI